MSRQQPGSYEVVWSSRRGSYRRELRVTPYANGGADIRLVSVGPRGGETVLEYVGGEQSAINHWRKYRAHQVAIAQFNSQVREFFPDAAAKS